MADGIDIKLKSSKSTSFSVSPKHSPATSITSYTGSSLEEELPFNVCSEQDLKQLPEECLSGIKHRPLRHVTENGEVYHYSLQPMFFSVVFILLVELLERFSFYGVNYTQTSFLTGVYNRDWNADMNSVAASSYVSISTAVGKYPHCDLCQGGTEITTCLTNLL
jgi:POT family proton-dependent oligopeptide transporter